MQTTRGGLSNERKVWKMTPQKIVGIAVVSIALLTFTSWSIAEEEHPVAEHPEEHAEEHPEEHHASVTRPEMSKEELAEAIQDYVARDSALKGGYFLVYDKKAGESLELSLIKVHKDRLSTIGHGVYFVCADFKTPEGKVYDLDIFMKGPDKDHLAVTEVSVHKEEGVERYTWYEEGGVWKKRHMEGSDTKGSATKHEHREEGSGTKGEHPEEGSASTGSGTKHEDSSEHPE